MTATVGRIVHFYRNAKPDPGFDAPNEEPLAAIVTRVHSDTCVDLMVFGLDGGIPGVTSVDSIPGCAPRWEWPPRV